MLSFPYQVKRINIGGVINVLGWPETLNPATRLTQNFNFDQISEIIWEITDFGSQPPSPTM